MDKLIYDNETIEDLQYNNLFILQKKNTFRFGTDAVLLNNFTKIKNNSKVCDFGCGTGILSILLSQKAQNIKITAFEIQENMADMARRSVEYNGLSNKITVVNSDYIKYNNYIANGSQDLVICNPPYSKLDSSIKNKIEGLGIAKHEIETTIEETIQAISRILKFGGKLSMCFPSERMIELIRILQKFKLEPKRLRPVYSNINKEAYLLLIEAAKGRNSGLRIEPPLIINNLDGTISREIKNIYHLN